MNRICIPDHEYQERIKKASNYFFEKLNDLENISEFINETDNKAVNLSIKTVLDMIKEILYVKTACLNLTKNGFDVKKYLEMKKPIRTARFVAVSFFVLS